MGVMRSIHRSLIRIPWWRRHQRHLARSIQGAAGLPNAYRDMFEIAERTNPAAILDIGSYVGDTIECFTDEFKTKIYGFEPTPDSFAKLSKRFTDTPQVELCNCALSDHEGQGVMFKNRNPQTNSFLDNDDGNRLSFPEDTEHLTSFDVDVQTLDG